MRFILRNRLLSKMDPIREQPLSLTLKRKLRNSSGTTPEQEQWEIEGVPTKRTTRASRKQLGPVKIEQDEDTKSDSPPPQSNNP